MPAAKAFSNRQPFKPPRPVGSSAPAVEPSTKNATSAAQESKPVGSRPVPKGLEPLDSSLDDEPNATAAAHDQVNVDSSSLAFSTLPQPGAVSADLAPKLQVIPPQLLSKLVHNHFRHIDTRITVEAMSVFAEYIETFVKEAVYRANHERSKQESGDGFLEVEDLEKLAPQLLQDF